MSSQTGATRNEARPTGTQAVERALSVLMAFTRASPELGISDLGRLLSMSPSTVHRLVRALVDRGFLEQNERSERYRLGRNLIILGQNAQHGLGLGQAQQFLERLGANTGESVNLGVRENADVVVLLRVESRQALRFDQEPGSHIPLHASSMGKSLLAFSEDPEGGLAELLREDLDRFTPTTLVDRDELAAEIAEVRRRGFSVDDEESLAGVRCVGVPVLDRRGIARAAIAVQAPAVRMPTERVEELGPLLQATAAEISALMGFDGGPDTPAT